MNNRNKKKKKILSFWRWFSWHFLWCAHLLWGKNGEKLAGVRTVEAASK